MKILVTGANGLLGQKLIERWQGDPSIDLYTTARRAAVLPVDPDKFFLADLTDPHAVEALVDRIKPDTIVHTAAMTQVDQCEQDKAGCWKVNVDAVDYLIQASRKNNAHLVHLSTDFIFDGSHGPLQESDQPNPVNYYGESKVAAEKLVMESGLTWSIVRTVLVYGITQDMSRSNIITWVKKNLEAGSVIKVVTDQWRTPTLAEDLAEGCHLVAVQRATGVYHISGKDFLTPHQMALQTADFFQLDASLIQETNAAIFKETARRPLRTGFIIDKAVRELGYAPHSFREGMALVSSQLKK
ncbi:SDR family oxidoreductase [Chryseolinea lacunae]|uniref:dTDP-4-dehydrorhamnose reductase n=1 Tax=Chryseolinea lacunae TaxID=2801331 RepID=A0ABS1KL88_9BACT|nr:SDR family oxidoreductase [Chryseolinea lacunae]MBL0740220.1 SDR family oxidoreductase [Chryseolinea lacunae]